MCKFIYIWMIISGRKWKKKEMEENAPRQILF